MTENTISQFVPSQLPNFVQEEYPEFCEFLKAYYEYLETENNPLYKTQRILKEISLDYTSEQGLEHFCEYIGKYLPSEYAGDKSHLLKHIKEFYLSRGTEESYKFFMSMVFGFDIGKKTKLDYPIQKVLHTSSGQWVQKKSLKLSYENIALSELIGKIIIDSNQTEAIIENVISYYIGDTRIIEVFLQTSSISDEFITGPAQIRDITGTFEILPVISGIDIKNSGTGYLKTDSVQFGLNYDGLQLALDPNKNVTLSSSFVSEWDSFNDIGGIVTQATGANRPLPTRSDSEENLVLFSEDFSDVKWIAERVTKSSNVINDPLSLELIADSIIEDTGTGTHGVYQNVDNIISGKTYRFSVYAKEIGTIRRLRMLLSIRFTNANVQWKDGAEEVSGAGANNKTVEDLGGGWYRYSFEATATSSGTAELQLYMITDAGVSSYTGDGTSGYYIFGAQIADASASVNYLPTTGIQQFSGINGNSLLYFDGINDSLQSNIPVVLENGFGAICFIRRDWTTGNKVLLASYSGVTADRRIYFIIGESGSIDLFIYDGAGNYIGRYAPASIIINGENAVLEFTYDGLNLSSGVKIYKNGIQVDTGNLESGTFVTHDTPGTNLRLGATDTGSNFQGLIGDVIYYQGFQLTEEYRKAITAKMYSKYFTTALPSHLQNVPTGIDAILKISDVVGGQIYKIDTVQTGINYDPIYNQTVEVISNTGQSFKAIPIIGATSNYPGFYSSNRNLISEESIRLHDNNFYQQFSYVVSSPVALNVYKEKLSSSLHPAGRKLFGKFQFEELIDYSLDPAELYGFIDATIWGQAEADNGYVMDIPVMMGVIGQQDPVSLLGISPEEIQFLSYRTFYPYEFAPNDAFLSNDHYGGQYAYNFSDKMVYIGGMSNTQAAVILGSEGLQPDPVLYRYPITRDKIEFWVTGSSRVKQNEALYHFNGNIESPTWKLDESSLFNVGNNSFGVKFDFIPEQLEDKAIIALCQNSISASTEKSNIDKASIALVEYDPEFIITDENSFLLELEDQSGNNNDAVMKIPAPGLLTDSSKYKLTGYIDFTQQEPIINDAVKRISSISDGNYFLTNNRENLSQASQNINSSLWTKGALTVDTTRVEFNGELVANTIIATAGSAIHSFYGVAPNTTQTKVGSSYRLWITVKKGTHRYIQLAFFAGPFTTNDYANFDLQDGVVGTVGSGATAFIRTNALDSNYYDIGIVSTGILTALSAPYIILVNSASAGRAASFNAAGTETVIIANVQYQRAEANADEMVITNRLLLPFTQSVNANKPLLTRSDNKENLVLYSEDISNAVWLAERVTKNSNVLANPVNGNITADQIVEDTGTGTHGIYQNVSKVVSGLKYRYSFYGKQIGSNRRLRSLLSVCFTNANVQWFNGDDVVSGAGASNITVTALENDWYKFSFEATATSTGTAEAQLYLIQDSGAIASYTGDGTSGWYIFGVQLQRAIASTEYISTTEYQQITSAIDGRTGAYLRGEQALVSSSQLTSIVDNNNKFVYMVIAPDLLTLVQILLEDDTNNLVLYLHNNGDLRIANWDGAAFDTAVTSPLSLSSLYIVRFRHTDGNVYAAIDSGSGFIESLPVPSGNTTSLTSTLRIGQRNGGTLGFYGFIAGMIFNNDSEINDNILDLENDLRYNIWDCRPKLLQNEINDQNVISFDSSKKNHVNINASVNPENGMYGGAFVQYKTNSGILEIQSAWVNDSARLSFSINAATGSISVIVAYDENNYIGRSTAAAAINEDESAIITWTYDGSESSRGIKIYKNGTRVDTTDQILGTYTIPEESSINLRIGARGHPTVPNYFHGYIGNIIFNQGETWPDSARKRWEKHVAIKYGLEPLADVSVVNSIWGDQETYQGFLDYSNFIGIWDPSIPNSLTELTYTKISQANDFSLFDNDITQGTDANRPLLTRRDNKGNMYMDSHNLASSVFVVSNCTKSGQFVVAGNNSSTKGIYTHTAVYGLTTQNNVIKGKSYTVQGRLKYDNWQYVFVRVGPTKTGITLDLISGKITYLHNDNMSIVSAESFLNDDGETEYTINLIAADSLNFYCFIYFATNSTYQDASAAPVTVGTEKFRFDYVSIKESDWDSDIISTGDTPQIAGLDNKKLLNFGTVSYLANNSVAPEISGKKYKWKDFSFANKFSAVFDPDEDATVDSQKRVSQLTDLSGNGNHSIQASDNQKPILSRSDNRENFIGFCDSENLSSGWSYANAVNVTADTFREDSATASHYAYVNHNNNVYFINGQNYKFSARIKPSATRNIRLEFFVTSTTVATLVVNSTGIQTSSSGSPQNVKIEPIGGGWFDVSFTKVSTLTGAGYFFFRMTLTDNTITYLGDGVTSVQVTRVQVQKVGTKEEYIRTTGFPIFAGINNNKVITFDGYDDFMTANALGSLVSRKKYKYKDFPYLSKFIGIYDPDENATVDAQQRISQLTDLSSNTNHATQGTNANKPLLTRADNRENRLQYSTANFANGTYWSTTGLTFTEGQADPLGGTAATLFTTSGGSARHYTKPVIAVSPSFAVGQVVRMSVWVKDNGSGFYTFVGLNDGAWKGTIINQATGVIQNTSGVTATVSGPTSGFYKVTILYTVAATGTVRLEIGHTDSTTVSLGPNTFNSDGLSLIFYNPQCKISTADEVDLVTTDYPILSGRNYNRMMYFDGVDDILSLTSTGIMTHVNGTDKPFTIIGLIDPNVFVATGGASPQVFAGVGANAILQHQVSSAGDVYRAFRRNDAAVDSIVETVSNVPIPRKEIQVFAHKFDGNNGRLFIDGNLIAAGPQGTGAMTLTQLNIGGRTSTVGLFSGYMGAVFVADEALTDAEIKEISEYLLERYTNPEFTEIKPYTLIAALKTNLTSTQEIVDINRSANSKPISMHYINTGYALYRRDDDAVDVTKGTVGDSTLNPQTVAWRFTGNRLSIFKNGIVRPNENNVKINLGELTLDQFYIGKNKANSEYFNGQMGAMFFSEEILEDSEIEQLSEYLQDRYTDPNFSEAKPFSVITKFDTYHTRNNTQTLLSFNDSAGSSKHTITMDTQYPYEKLSSWGKWIGVFDPSRTVTYDSIRRIDQLSDLSGAGNHATQSTAGNKPILSRSDNKENLVLGSWRFSSAPSGSEGLAYSLSEELDTSGHQYTILTATAASSRHGGWHATSEISAQGTNVRYSVEVKKGNNTWIWVGDRFSSWHGTAFNFDTGAFGDQVNLTNRTVESLGNGRFRITIEYNKSSASQTSPGVYIHTSSSGSAPATFLAAGTETVLVAKPQFNFSTSDNVYIETSVAQRYWAGVNGNEVMIFNGSTSCLSLSATAIQTHLNSEDRPYTVIFAVWPLSFAAVGGSSPTILGGVGTTSIIMNYLASSTGRPSVYRRDEALLTATVSSVTDNSRVPQIYAAVFNGTNATIYKDGVEVATGSANTGTMNISSVFIGAATSTTSGNFNGKIGAGFVSDRVLSLEEIQELSDHLLERYTDPLYSDMRISSNRIDSEGNIKIVSVPNTNSNSVYSFIFDGAETKIYEDGTLKAQDSQVLGTAIFDQFSVGADKGATNYLNADLGFLAISNTVLSNESRDLWEKHAAKDVNYELVKQRAWGIGFNEDKKVYVNIFDDSDTFAEDSSYTYEHSSVLPLDQTHSVLFSYNDDDEEIILNVNGVEEVFSHTHGIKQLFSPGSLTIGSTQVEDVYNRANSFGGTIKNLAFYNRTIDSNEYSLLSNKSWNRLYPLQRHGMIFFTELNYPKPVDSSDFNYVMTPYYNEDLDSYVPSWKNIELETSNQFKHSITKISDQVFWSENTNTQLLTFGDSKEVYNSSYGTRENLIIASNNLESSIFSNIETIISPNETNIKLMDLGVGISGEFIITPNVDILETGLYTLKFGIQANIQNELGNIKGFEILQNGIVIARLYKRLSSYYFLNTSFDISEDGNWINCVCNLDIQNLNQLNIRLLSTDDTSYYSTFVPNTANSLDIRNFHLYKNSNTIDTSYIQTKNIPILSGKYPSIVLQDYSDGYEVETTKFNIQHKAIFCVCVNESTIIDGPDFKLTTDEFITNRHTSPVTVSIAAPDAGKLQLIKAYHLDSDILLSRKSIGMAETTDSDFAVNSAPSSGNVKYTLLSNNDKFKLYELIVLNNPSNDELDATENYLLEKYGI